MTPPFSPKTRVPKKLAIIGASGHGKVVAELALASGWDCVVFFDIAWPGHRKNGEWDIVGNTKTLLETLSSYNGFTIAIGNCTIRSAQQRKVGKAGGQAITLVHPAATLSPSASIGAGTVIMAGAVINAGAIIGKGCIVNSNAVIEHDCTLEDYVHIAPGAVLSGNCTVGKRSWMGVGAVARQGSLIGKDVMVGAGAVVINAVEDGLTVTGCPAAPLPQKPR